MSELTQLNTIENKTLRGSKSLTEEVLRPTTLKRLTHNGVLLSKYKPKGFQILFRGKPIKLSPEQEEMAVAWAKKQETPYVGDPVFVKNFLGDFGKALNISSNVTVSDFDFTEIIQWVERERTERESMSKEDKKHLALSRKEFRQANKEKYGYAIVDGQRVEVGNYMVEPACIFMGRGKHPLRGKWKPAVKQEEITLNLSPGAPVPEGRWKEVVWQPDSMWIARWNDPLRGKEKYVWLSDTAPFIQKREEDKFNNAERLKSEIGKIRSHIQKNLTSDNLKRRRLATVCYLIDTLKIRVGDEKDKDEADTFGATTLRPEHITFLNDGNVQLDFLGKDSVPFKRAFKPPREVLNNLKDFIQICKLDSSPNKSVFRGIRGDLVSTFLQEVIEGASARVFRTYHATETVRKFLSDVKVTVSDPEWKKKEALTMANLQVAALLNHKRTLPKNFQKSLAKREAHLKEMEAKEKKTEKQKEAIENLRSKIKLMKETKECNLGTSLRNYIDPRAVHQWCQKVGYNWCRYYPKTLQRKYGWIESSGGK